MAYREPHTIIMLYERECCILSILQPISSYSFKVLLFLKSIPIAMWLNKNQ